MLEQMILVTAFPISPFCWLSCPGFLSLPSLRSARARRARELVQCGSFDLPGRLFAARSRRLFGQRCANASFSRVRVARERLKND